MINKLLDISTVFKSIGKIIGLALVGVVVIILLVLLLRFKETRKLTLYALSVIIITFGIISCVNIKSTFDTKSKEIGSAFHLEQKYNYNIIAEFDFGTIEFDSDDNVNYKNIKSEKTRAFNGVDKNYIMLFNGEPADINNVSAGKMDSTFKFTFYDTEEKVLAIAEVRIVIEFLAKETRITTTMKNTNSSVSYMDSYMEINGCIIKIIGGTNYVK